MKVYNLFMTILWSIYGIIVFYSPGVAVALYSKNDYSTQSGIIMFVMMIFTIFHGWYIAKTGFIMCNINHNLEKLLKRETVKKKSETVKKKVDLQKEKEYYYYLILYCDIIEKPKFDISGITYADSDTVKEILYKYEDDMERYVTRKLFKELDSEVQNLYFNKFIEELYPKIKK